MSSGAILNAADHAPTPAARALMALIEAEGPIPVSRFMAEALMHPQYGYYRKGDPIGARGDFITAPEISQTFGELIGLWLAERWEAIGRPRPARLVELGPGRGTLMADALRAMQVVDGLPEALSIHFVESNETLSRKQAALMHGLVSDVHWHEDFGEVPDGPLLLIANEFFDALPIRQLVRRGDHWAERMVTTKSGHFAFTHHPLTEGAAALPEALAEAQDGTVVELCPAGETLAGSIAGRVVQSGGAALIVDYGYGAGAHGESLQAVRRHQPVDIFTRIGECDLTAHVNFERLAQAASAAGAEVAGPTTQGAFLDALGIQLRAAMLSRRATDAQAREIKAGVRRLTAPDMMGELFKVLAILPPGDKAAEGAAEPPGGRHG